MTHVYSRTATRRASVIAGSVAVPVLALALSACGGGSGGSSAPRAVAPSSDAPCSAVSGKDHARVVVEVSPSKIVSSCVGFSKSTVKAIDLLKKSGIELGTQTFSYGVGVCQVDHVPAHYTTCFPSNADYWALFISRDGAKWQSASVGAGDLVVHPGDSIGLRYDPPTGSAAPPPAPKPA